MTRFAPCRPHAILPASVLVALAQERSTAPRHRVREIDRLIQMDAQARGMAAARPVAAPARAAWQPAESVMYLPPREHWRTVPLATNAPVATRPPAPVMAANRPPEPLQFAPITPHWQSAPAATLAANTGGGAGDYWAKTELAIQELRQRQANANQR